MEGLILSLHNGFDGYFDDKFVIEGHESNIDMLLDLCIYYNLEIDKLNMYGYNLLHKSIMTVNYSLFRKLLSSKCDPNRLTRDGKTCVDLIVDNLNYPGLDKNILYLMIQNLGQYKFKYGYDGYIQEMLTYGESFDPFYKLIQWQLHLPLNYLPDLPPDWYLLILTKPPHQYCDYKPSSNYFIT